MPEDATQNAANQPPSLFLGWLAANKKLAILIGLVVILVLALGVTMWRPWAKKTAGNNINAVNNSATTNTSTNSKKDRTFESFQATVNRPTTNTNTVTRPTKEDTAQAIKQLNNTNAN